MIFPERVFGSPGDSRVRLVCAKTQFERFEKFEANLGERKLADKTASETRLFLRTKEWFQF